MRISSKDWKNYIDKLSKLNNTAGEKMSDYVARHGFDDPKIIDYAYGLVTKYGEGSASLSAMMYDAIAEMEGKILPPAEVAQTPEYGEVAKAVNGVRKHSKNPTSYGNVVNRLVKRTGADTMLKNAERDGAEFAWIPSGDTFAFCIALASRGWQHISKKSLKNGHAEHIHANCDCNYTVRFDGSSSVAGYNPDEYLEIYENAEGNTPEEKINSIRAKYRAENKDKINAQKREAYAENKNLSMKRNSKTIWNGQPQIVSESEIKELKNYASDKNFKLDKSFYSFDGDVDLVKDFLSYMDKNINNVSLLNKHRIRLSVSYSLDDDTYAVTNGPNITINGFAYRDRNILDKDYNNKVESGYFTKGSSYLDIATHESAHIIVVQNQLKYKETRVSVFGKNKQNSSKEIKSRISKYALKNNHELIAESYVSYINGSEDEYVLKVLKYCGILK